MQALQAIDAEHRSSPGTTYVSHGSGEYLRSQLRQKTEPEMGRQASLQLAALCYHAPNDATTDCHLATSAASQAHLDLHSVSLACGNLNKRNCMRKLFWLIGIITCALFVAGCTLIRGSGNLQTETRQVSNFSAITLSTSGTLIIEQTGTESLTITAEDNLLPYITSEVSNGRLILGTRPNTGLQTTQEITYRLTVKDLKEIEVSGSGNVQSSSINTDQLKALVSGSGNITLTGTAQQQDVTVSGSGSYEGANLQGTEATVTVSGSGNAVVNASDRLTARVSGSGSITYLGNPQVTENISGSGSVRKR